MTYAHEVASGEDKHPDNQPLPELGLFVNGSHKGPIDGVQFELVMQMFAKTDPNYLACNLISSSIREERGRLIFLNTRNQHQGYHGVLLRF